MSDDEQEEFLVYKFGKQDYRIVLPHWLNDNKTQVWFPPYENQADIEEAILNNDTPNLETWKIFDVVTLIAEKDEFLKAKECLEMIKNMTDPDSEVDDQKLKRSRSKRHKKRMISDSDESSEESSVRNNKKPNTSKQNKRPLAPFVPPKPPQSFKPLGECCDEQKNEETSIGIAPAASKVANALQTASPKLCTLPKPPSVTKNGSTTSKDRTSAINAEDGSMSNESDSENIIETDTLQEIHKNVSELSIRDMFKVIYEGMTLQTRKCNAIIANQKEIIRRIKDLENTAPQMPPLAAAPNQFEVPDLDDLLPLRNIEKFEEFQNKLKDENFHAAKVHHMKSIGGEDLHVLTQRILKRFVADSLAQKFNVEGKFVVKRDSEGNELERKLPFKDTTLYKSIIKAAKLKDKNKMDEASLRSKTIGPWLAGSNLRLQRSRAKMERKTNAQQK